MNTVEVPAHFNVVSFLIFTVILAFFVPTTFRKLREAVKEAMRRLHVIN
jgi:hypothetical protein